MGSRTSLGCLFGALAALSTPACGGRSLDVSDTAAAGSSSAGASNAGASSAGAASAGASNAGAPSAGASNAGGGAPAGPFTVSEYFSPSFGMGDAATPGFLTTQVNTQCKERLPGARGDCYRFEYTPGRQLWVGMYWMYPANNWGAVPGLPVHGETLDRLTFRAAASRAPQEANFFFGGIDGPTANPPQPYSDQFHRGITVSLTTEWQQFEIDLTPPFELEPISSLIGGFGWTLNLEPGSEPQVLYLDDIAYE